MRLRMTDSRERRVDDLYDATGKSIKSKALTVSSPEVGPPGFEPGLSAPKAERIPSYPTVPYV